MTETERDDLDADAGEYVLGTMADEERVRFEMRVRQEPAVREAVARWERRLLPLAGLAPAIEPPSGVFERVQRTIQVQGRPSRDTRRNAVRLRTRLWNSLRLWRAVAASATILAAIFAILMLLKPPPSSMTYIAVLNAADGQPKWLVSADPADNALTIDSVGPFGAEHQVPELWLVPGGAQPPVSLGLLDPTSTTRRAIPGPLQQRIATGATLAVSLEPPGGSTTGAPTGPVVETGTVVPYQR